MSASHDAGIIALHNQFQGKRCFVLGNGPSLLKQDLGKLKDEYTFACNGFPQWKDAPFQPSFYGVSDIKDAIVFKKLPIDRLTTPFKFNVQWAHRRAVHDPRFVWVEKAQENIQVHPHGTVGMGEELPPIPTGRTTPLTIAQLALWMGFHQIYFLGVEQSSGYVYNPEATITIQGGEMLRTERYLKALQRCFTRARSDAEAVGREIVDCTPGGFLTGHGGHPNPKAILPYKRLEEVL